MVWLKISLLTEGGRTRWPLIVPSNSNYAMVLYSAINSCTGNKEGQLEHKKGPITFLESGSDAFAEGVF